MFHLQIRIEFQNYFFRLNFAFKIGSYCLCNLIRAWNAINCARVLATYPPDKNHMAHNGSGTKSLSNSQTHAQFIFCFTQQKRSNETIKQTNYIVHLFIKQLFYFINCSANSSRTLLVSQTNESS